MSSDRPNNIDCHFNDSVVKSPICIFNEAKLVCFIIRKCARHPYQETFNRLVVSVLDMRKTGIDTYTNLNTEIGSFQSQNTYFYEEFSINILIEEKMKLVYNEFLH